MDKMCEWKRVCEITARDNKIEVKRMMCIDNGDCCSQQQNKGISFLIKTAG